MARSNGLGALAEAVASLEGLSFACNKKKDGSYGCKKITSRGASVQSRKTKVVYIKSGAAVAAGKNPSPKQLAQQKVLGKAAKGCAGKPNFKVCMSKALGTSPAAAKARAAKARLRSESMTSAEQKRYITRAKKAKAVKKRAAKKA